MTVHRQIVIAPAPERVPEADRPALAALAHEAFELASQVQDHVKAYPALQRIGDGIVGGLNSIGERIAAGLEAGADDAFFAPGVVFAFENARAAAEDLLKRQNLEEFERLALQTPPETVREFNPPQSKAAP
jgi:hypothetical protein